MTQAFDDIWIERARQINEEGWSTDHDDSHAAGELSSAAAVYATWFIPELGEQIKGAAWPWSAAWFKPKNVRHDLVRAAALIVAEIERLDRAQAREKAAAA